MSKPVKIAAYTSQFCEASTTLQVIVPTISAELLVATSSLVHPVKFLHSIPELLLTVRAKFLKSLGPARLVGFFRRPHVGTPHFSDYRMRRRTVLFIGGIGRRLGHFSSTRKSPTEIIFKILAPHEAVHAQRCSPHF